MAARPRLRQDAKLPVGGDSRRRQPHGGHLDLPRNGVGRDLRPAAIRDVHEIDAGLQLQHLDRDMQRAADPAAAVTDRARVRLA